MSKILEMVARIHQKRVPRQQHYIVHIDDCVIAAREFRKQGLKLVRGRLPDKSRGNYFQIRDGEQLIGLLAVNVYRNMNRGEVFTFNEPPSIWTMERIEGDWDYDDWYRNRLLNPTFRRFYYGAWFYPPV